MRKYVCAYFSWQKSMAKCSDECFGRLVRAALRYAEEGSLPSFATGSPEDIIWGMLQAQIDADHEKYDKKVAAGQKGNEVRWRGKDKTVPEEQKNGQQEIEDMKAFIASMG